MAALQTTSPFQADIVCSLKMMAAEGVSLEQMVIFVQGKLGFSSDFVVPVLGYFCEAFSLPLLEVLPLREWWETRDVALSNQLNEKIRTRQLGQLFPTR